METESTPEDLTHDEAIDRAQSRLKGFQESFDGDQVNVGDIVQAFPLVQEDVPRLLGIIADQKTELYKLRNACHPCGGAGRRTYDGEVCNRCAGRGYVPPPCETCNGFGEVGGLTPNGYESDTCPVCQGNGFVDEGE